MSAARKLGPMVNRNTNVFSASIDNEAPLEFQATFAQIYYPNEGDPPRWTIEARFRHPQSFHIKTIRIIFIKNPSDDKPHKADENLRIIYSDSEEDPPSEYVTSSATTAISFNPEDSSTQGNISAKVADGLDPPKSHVLTINFELQASVWSKKY